MKRGQQTHRKTNTTILRRIGMALLATLAPTVVALASAQSLQRADELAGEQKWEEAAAIYRMLVDADPEDAAAWYGAARARHELGESSAAAEAYRKSIQLNHNPGRARFHFARLLASQGESRQAIRLLEEARRGGMRAYQALLQTPEFAPLQEDGDFVAIVEKMKPCVGPEYRHFDFWLGEWEVTTPQGQPAGSNRISQIQGKCVLLEEWTASSGGTGTSFNTFNTSKGVWQQFWVDAQGSVLELSGGLEDGAMVMRSDPEASPIHRITWTPRADGSVRQHWESSTDDGQSWNTAFDGIYRRKTSH